MFDQVIEPLLRENCSSSGHSAMWAREVEAETMMDPVDVKDLRLPGQKLIQVCDGKLIIWVYLCLWSQHFLTCFLRENYFLCH